MKSLLFGVIFAGVFAFQSQAEISFPDGTYDHSQMEEARKQALTENKPLAYILSNAEDREGNAEFLYKTTNGYIDAVKDKAVIIYLSANKRAEFEPLADWVLGAALGRGFPVMALVSPKDGYVTLAMSASDYLTSNDADKRIEKALMIPNDAKRNLSPVKLRFPSGYYNYADVDKACEAARKAKKPVAFIYTDKDISYYPWVHEPTNAMLECLGNSCVLVYLNIKENKENAYKNAPKVVRVTTGLCFPVLSIVSPDNFKSDKVPLFVDERDYDKGAFRKDFQEKITRLVKDAAAGKMWN